MNNKLLVSDKKTCAFAAADCEPVNRVAIEIQLLLTL
jgi:hypothetical protein